MVQIFFSHELGFALEKISTRKRSFSRGDSDYSAIFSYEALKTVKTLGLVLCILIGNWLARNPNLCFACAFSIRSGTPKSTSPRTRSTFAFAFAWTTRVGLSMPILCVELYLVPVEHQHQPHYTLYGSTAALGAQTSSLRMETTKAALPTGIATEDAIMEERAGVFPAVTVTQDGIMAAATTAGSITGSHKRNH